MSDTKYTIDSIEDDTTSNDKDMKRIKLSNGDSVNLFKHHDRFNTLSEGDKIDKDELYVNSSGYTDLKDQPGDSRPDSADPYEGKTNEIDKAMTRKERGIMMSSTARMAADMVTAEIENGDIEGGKIQKQDRWRMWRSFFAGNWDNIDEDWQDPEDLIPE